MIRKKKSINSDIIVKRAVCEKQLLELLKSFSEKQKKFNSEIRSKTEYLEVITHFQKSLPEIYAVYDKYCYLYLDMFENSVTCSKSCSYCCCHTVTSVEPYEIMRIDWILKQSAEYSTYMVRLFQRWRVFEEIAKMEKSYDEDVVLYKDYLKGIPCPFLSFSKKCSIYNIRPIPCRMFFSLSKPLLCEGENTVSKANKNIVVELSDEIEEHLAEAGNFLEQYEISPFLFKGLMDVNQLFGKYSLEK